MKVMTCESGRTYRFCFNESLMKAQVFDFKFKLMPGDSKGGRWHLKSNLGQSTPLR
jgi:hypothetical protein